MGKWCKKVPAIGNSQVLPVAASRPAHRSPKPKARCTATSGSHIVRKGARSHQAKENTDWHAAGAAGGGTRGYSPEVTQRKCPVH